MKRRLGHKVGAYSGGRETGPPTGNTHQLFMILGPHVIEPTGNMRQPVIRAREAVQVLIRRETHGRRRPRLLAHKEDDAPVDYGGL